MLKRMTVDDVGPSSIRIELSFIRSTYTKAIGMSSPSPEIDTKRPKVKMKSREERLDNVITPAELSAILEEAQNRGNNLYYFLLFLLYTRMRPREAAQLYLDRLPAKQEREHIKKKQPVGYVDLQRREFTKHLKDIRPTNSLTVGCQ